MIAPKEIGLHLCALHALRDLVDQEIAVVRADMSTALLHVQAEMGADRVVVSLPGEDGPEKVASVSLVKESDGIDIDPAGFLDWTKENAPDEVVCAVRDSFRRGLLTHLEVAGDDVVDRRTGSVVDFARPRPTAGPTGKFTLRFEGGTNGAGRERIAAAWRDGQLAHVLAAASFTPAGALPVGGVEQP